MPTNLPALLETARLRAGFKTVYAAAKATGYSTSQMYDWEAGSYRPKIDKLARLAEVYGVEVTYFLVGK